MSERGTIIIDRGVFGHPAFADEPFTEREAWIWLIAQAAWKEHERRVGRARVTLRRGELAYASRYLGQAWKWSQSRVMRFLARLTAESMIIVKSGSLVTHLTICKYDVYQKALLEIGSEAVQKRFKLEGREIRADDDAVTRARASELAEQVYDIFGFDRAFIPPAWCGLQHWLEAGLRGGWKPDLVRLAAKKVSRGKRGTPNSFRYLGPVIVQEHELAAAPVPATPVVPPRQLPLVSMMENASETPTRNHPRDWKSSRDEWRVALGEFKDHVAEIDAGEEGCGQNVPFAAAARRE